MAVRQASRVPTTAVTDQFIRELQAMLTSLVERSPLFAELSRRGLGDDLVQETLIAVTQRIQDGHVIEDPFLYARRCVTNLAKRTYGRVAREPAVGDEILEHLGPATEDVAVRAEHRAVMSEVLEMVRTVNAVIVDLEPVDLALVRAELARTDQKRLAAALGISRPTLYRRKGRAITAFVASVAARAGTTPCPEHVGALLAAAGGSGFDGARAAAEHAATCQQCRETVRHLQVAGHGLAILGPLPLVAHASGDPVRIIDRAHLLLDAIADWVRTIAVRVGDPMPLGAPATKTAALVAAACTGGTGVYCAVDGIPPALKTPFTHRAAPPDGGGAEEATTRAKSGALSPIVARPVARASSAVTRASEQEAARRTATAKAARRKAAAARRHKQAAREFAARQAAAAAAHTEFAGPAASPATPPVVAQREFGAAPRAGSSTQVKREFGAP